MNKTVAVVVTNSDQETAPIVVGKSFGFEMTVLRNPSIEAIQQVVPDVVLFDWSPCTIERNTVLVGDIRSSPSLRDTPIFVFHSSAGDLPEKLRTNVIAFEVPVGRQNVRRALEKLLPGMEPNATTDLGLAARKIFIVHGHDGGARDAVARFVEHIGFQPIVLHEQASQGRTVIEKVEVHGDVRFAIVLLTPDDEGCLKGGHTRPRARQNVVLELGYFIGRLGRNRVCALKRGDLELPSDFEGVVYQTFDELGGWKSALGRELQAAGFTVDWNKVMLTE